MHTVIQIFIETADAQKRPHTITDGRFIAGGVTLEADPSCESDDPAEFRLSWPQTADFSEDLTYSMMLLIFTLGKGYDDDGLMARIGQHLSRGNRFSETRGGWIVSSFISDGRCHLHTTKS